MEEKTNIIFIMSTSHSGSTLLDLILGSHSQILSGGEINHTWDSGLMKNYPAPLTHADISHPALINLNRTCSCGLPGVSCSYWQEVLKNLRKPGKSRQAHALEAATRAMLDAAGRNFLCDSSKNTEWLEQYLLNDHFRPQIIHLLRDPRAVGYSFKRKGEFLKKKAGINNQREMDAYLIHTLRRNKNTYEYPHAVFNWMRGNLKRMRKFSEIGNYQMVLYENLVCHPVETIKTILFKLGLAYEPSMAEYQCQTHHILEGNRIRLDKKPVQFNPSYVEELSFREWWAGTCIAFPLLLKLGYPLPRSKIRDHFAKPG